MGFPSGSDSKVSAYNVGDLGSIPGSGRSLEKLGCRNTDALKPTALHIIRLLVDICISTHLSL